MYYWHSCVFEWYIFICELRKKESGPGSDLARTWPDPSGPGPVRSRSRSSQWLDQTSDSLLLPPLSMTTIDDVAGQRWYVLLVISYTNLFFYFHFIYFITTSCLQQKQGKQQMMDVTSVNLNISHGTSYELVRARTRPKKGKKSKSNKYKQLGSFLLKSPNL